ncbi:MAG: hypothetical protein ACKOB1_05945, partial [Planctomycetia bacterium]
MRHPVRHRSPIAAGLAAACMLAGGCGRTPPSPVAPAAPALPSPPPLCARIEAAIAHARDARRLDASVHGAWQVVHGILAFGPDFPLARDGVVGPALDYLLGGSPLIGWQLRPGKRGIVAVVEEGSTTGQGHPDQWLGYLSQCGLGGVPLDTKLVVGGRDFTLADLLAQAQFDIRPGQEATWTLMALAAYLPPDASWQASDGTAWTIERVVQMEADADLSTSACGGAHRLYGLVAAVNARRAELEREADGRPAVLTGGWAVAEERIEDAIDRARRFQQADGSFSVHFFERPGTSSDVFARLAATGHVFEVLVLALDDERLSEPWIRRAADRLVTLLDQ